MGQFGERQERSRWEREIERWEKRDLESRWERERERVNMLEKEKEKQVKESNGVKD